MKNRFNNLTSKEWLPFQKSWFMYENQEKLYRDNIRFFAKEENETEKIYYSGPDEELFEQICRSCNFQLTQNVSPETALQFALFDLRPQITPETTPDAYHTIRDQLIEQLKSVYEQLTHRRFVSIFIPNLTSDGDHFPFAWDLARHISTIFSLKDEKIACIDNTKKGGHQGRYFQPLKQTFYCLYFRKDENSPGSYNNPQIDFFKNTTQQTSGQNFTNDIPSWFILKPPRRKKNEIRHPAKYPEALVEKFIREFTKENDNVFDPMSGTGSTQVAALRQNRNGYGCELSEFFTEIANERCHDLVNSSREDLFEKSTPKDFNILKKDARQIEPGDFPEIDYMITSPPYWDMLNMKGAENQAKRVKKGLQTNYSDSQEDLGNINDYRDFMYELIPIYHNVIRLIKPGGYLTIIVKNIKKKGRNYPFAWDLAHELQKELILLPEVFWCQDDISIAPYGYGNTWVSNTFHQYCLNFQKPE